MHNYSLLKIQSWIQTALTCQGNLAEKVNTTQQRSGLGISQVIKSSKGISAEQRLDIYVSGYTQRLVEYLKDDYPGLVAFMGVTLFEVFAKSYIVNKPSVSWSLFHLGENFPYFLNKTKPKSDPLFSILVAIATFERAKKEIQFSKGPQPSRNSDLRLGFSFDWVSVHTIIKPSHCYVLLSLDFPIHTYIKKLTEGKSPKLPDLQKNLLVVYQNNYEAHTTRLVEWQYLFLQQVKMYPNREIGSYLDKIGQQLKIKPSSLLAKLLMWLPIIQSMHLLELADMEPSQ